jgi:hypothetical protein
MDEFEDAASLALLSEGERLLLRTIRALALEIRCRGFRAPFEAACGWAGGEAFRALEVFVAQVGLKGRRRLSIGLPGSGYVSLDEALLLAAFASAQSEDYRDMALCLRALLGCEPQPPLAAAVCLVAEALAMNGLMLRWRDTGLDVEPARREQPHPACQAERREAGHQQVALHADPVEQPA